MTEFWAVTLVTLELKYSLQEARTEQWARKLLFSTTTVTSHRMSRCLCSFRHSSTWALCTADWKVNTGRKKEKVRNLSFWGQNTGNRMGYIWRWMFSVLGEISKMDVKNESVHFKQICRQRKNEQRKMHWFLFHEFSQHFYERAWHVWHRVAIISCTMRQRNISILPHEVQRHLHNANKILRYFPREAKLLK